MNILKRHPLFCAFLIVFLGVIGGTIIGWLYAGYVVQSIAEGVRRTNPNDPLDGLPFIAFGITFMGLIGGFIMGVIGGIIVYIVGKRQLRARNLQ
jgi:hypothetical protein